MKTRLSRSLLFYDIIAFIFIFTSVFIVFESVIKKIFINYGADKFVSEMSVLQFDASAGLATLESKNKLDYQTYVDKCFNYLKQSYLSKAKYDESVIYIVFPDGKITGGKKNDINYKLNMENIYGSFSKIAEESSSNLTQFSINNVKYIGIVEKSKTGVRNNLNRSDSVLVYPIFIIANKVSDFFYLIDLTRLFFIIWLFIIMGIIAIFKIKLTSKAASDIKKISLMLRDESVNIRTRGIIGESLRNLESDFIEVNDLNTSSIQLNNSLVDLRNVVKGVTNEEFFIGTITGNKMITEQHEINCTVMFLDIKGFTTISEKHKSQSMKIGIAIFSMVGDILKKYNGQIRKLLGDAALITFKDNDMTSRQHAINALRSAIEILAAVKDVNHKLNEKYNPTNDKNLEIDFTFRIGIDSGIVNEGLYGTPDNFEYGIIGDPVNTASRFEALNKQYYTNILINENTYKLVSTELKITGSQPIGELHNYSFFVLDEARTKGKQESGKIMTIYKNTPSGIHLLGWNNFIPLDGLSKFEEVYVKFKRSIAYWKRYKIDGDESAFDTIKKEWSDIVKEFALVSANYSFLPAKQFIKLMIKFEDYEIFEKNIEEFNQKDDFQFKTPSNDWLTNKMLARELDK